MKAIAVQLGLLAILALLTFIAPAAAQQPNGTPPATVAAPVAATVAPVDFEAEAITYRKRALDVQREAAIQPQLIAIREQLLAQIDKQPAVQAELKAIAAMEKAYSDRKVKEAGKDPGKFRWDGKEAVAIPATPIAEKK